MSGDRATIKCRRCEEMLRPPPRRDWGEGERVDGRRDARWHRYDRLGVLLAVTMLTWVTVLGCLVVLAVRWAVG